MRAGVAGRPGPMVWLVCAALAVGCGVRPTSLGPSSGPEDAAGPLLRSDAIEAVATRLVQEAETARRDGILPAGEPHLLLPPFAPRSLAGDGAALTWALARRMPRLRPFAPRDTLASVSAALAWVRTEIDREPLLWAVEVHPTGPTAQLVVLSRESSWRSPELDLPAIPLVVPWPLSVPARPGPGSVAAEGGEYLRRLEGTVWLETRAGRQRLWPRRGRLALDRPAPWERWNRTWAERFDGREGLEHRAWADLAGDARLELRTEPGNESGQRLRWWIARGDAALPLPLHRELESRIVSLAPASESGLESPTWLALLENAQGDTWVDLLSAPLRLVPLARARSRHASRGSAGPSVVSQAGVPPASEDWPRDRWSLWHRVHEGVQLATWHGSAARAEPMARFTSRNGGRQWEVRLTLPRARGTGPEVKPVHVQRALRDRLEASATVPSYDWLTGPLRAARIDADSQGLSLRFPAAVPDLVERLAHPALGLTEPRLAARYATHQPRAARLVPRQRRGMTLVVETDALGDSPAGYLAAGRQLLRPYRHTLDLSTYVLGANDEVWWSASADGTGRLRSRWESPTDVVLVCDAAAPERLRRRLAAAVRRLGTPDLLALSDTALAARAPASGDPLGVSGRTAREPADPAPVGPDDDGEPDFALVLLDSDAAGDPNGEIARAYQRLRHVLALENVVVGRPGSPAVRAIAAERRVLARIQRVSLFSGEILLRALELASWVGEFPALESARQAAQQPVGDRGRIQAAFSLEAALLDGGLVIPLWREPGLVLVDTRIEGEGPIVPGLPILLREASPTGVDAGGGASP